MELTISDLPPVETINNNTDIPNTPYKSILKTNTKNINTNINTKNINTKSKRVSYEDILAKMGMFVDNGKLHLVDKCSNSNSGSNSNSNSVTSFKEQCAKPTMQCSKVKCNRIQESLKQNNIQNNIQNKDYYSQQEHSLQNSYIYNKHFKNHISNTVPKVEVPTTPQEYKQMLFKKIIENKVQQLRIKRLKSTKLIMPTENIHIASEPLAKLNRLFHFSQ
jgi:hypothetical protein